MQRLRWGGVIVPSGTEAFFILQERSLNRRVSDSKELQEVSETDQFH